MSRQSKNKLNILISSVVLCVFAFLIMIVYIPKALGYKTFYIKTGSMEQTIPQGSLVFARKIKFTEVRTGDVITFTNDNKNDYFTHRVVEIDAENQMLITKGDANEQNDPYPTSFYYAVGRVDFSIPYVGYAVGFINSTIGKVIVAAVYIAWIAVEIELYAMKRRADQEDLE
ncbi:MAG: signal peptidase I [Clostridia bacterium]|nr:signal peptidase I [Clostridia bacterium]